MKRTGSLVAASMLLAVALPAVGKSYKNTYYVPCKDVWSAVKAVLANEDNYAKVTSDDAKMTADYAPKHSVHFDVSGVILQRMNHVTLVQKETGCEMNVVSNYSGWGHEDQSDFKKRVDDTMTQPKDTKPAADKKSAAPGK